SSRSPRSSSLKKSWVAVRRGTPTRGRFADRPRPASREHGEGARIAAASASTRRPAPPTIRRRDLGARATVGLKMAGVYRPSVWREDPREEKHEGRVPVDRHLVARI